jgi:predicted negative regulator of RcsB-dependent stress response
MKSERRHELEHNTLDTELSNMVTFFKSHWVKLVYGVLIVVLAVVGFRYYQRQHTTKALNYQTRYEQLVGRSMDPATPQPELVAGFEELAEQTTTPYLAANSLLQLGKLFAIQSTLAAPGEGEKAAEKAEVKYKRVISEHTDLPEQTASARMGLATLAENRGDYPAARKEYETILAMKGLEGYPVLTQATIAMEGSKKWTRPATLATTLPAWVKPDPAPEAPEAPALPEPTPAPTPTPAPAPAPAPATTPDAPTTD